MFLKSTYKASHMLFLRGQYFEDVDFLTCRSSIEGTQFQSQVQEANLFSICFFYFLLFFFFFFLVSIEIDILVLKFM